MKAHVVLFVKTIVSIGLIVLLGLAVVGYLELSVAAFKAWGVYGYVGTAAIPSIFLVWLCIRCWRGW